MNLAHRSYGDTTVKKNRYMIATTYPICQYIYKTSTLSWEHMFVSQKRMLLPTQSYYTHTHIYIYIYILHNSIETISGCQWSMVECRWLKANWLSTIDGWEILIMESTDISVPGLSLRMLNRIWYSSTFDTVKTKLFLISGICIQISHRHDPTSYTRRDTNIWPIWLCFYRIRNSKCWRRHSTTKYVWRNRQCCQICSWEEVTWATALSESKCNRKADSTNGTCFIYQSYDKNKRWF